jgi:hypothetical protein
MMKRQEFIAFYFNDVAFIAYNITSETLMHP